MRTQGLCLLLAVLIAGGCGKTPVPEREPLPPEVRTLIDDLLGDDHAARHAAHNKLPEYGTAIVRPLAALLDRDDLNDGKGAWIAEVLGQLGPDAQAAAPALGRRLRKGGECAATTSWALETMGEAGLPELIASMGSEHGVTRQWASEAINDVAAQLGEKAAPARAAMARALDDSEKWTRVHALRALANIGGAGARSAAPGIIARLRDDDGDVASAALDATVRLGLWNDRVHAFVKELLAASDDERAYVRLDALGVVRDHVKDDAVALPLLRLGLRAGADEELRYQAIRALLMRGVDDLELALEFADVGKHAETRVVLWTAEHLLRPGPNAQRAALPLLVRALKRGDEEQRVRAAGLIAKTGRVALQDEPTLKALEHHAHHSGAWPAVREACREALEALRAGR